MINYHSSCVQSLSFPLLSYLVPLRLISLPLPPSSPLALALAPSVGPLCRTASCLLLTSSTCTSLSSSQGPSPTPEIIIIIGENIPWVYIYTNIKNIFVVKANIILNMLHITSNSRRTTGYIFRPQSVSFIERFFSLFRMLIEVLYLILTEHL